MMTTATPELILDEDTHTYYLGKDEIPGVTRVLADIGLLSTEWVTPEALYRGRYVHQAIHFLNEGDYDLADCLPQFRGFVESWIKFRDRMDLRLKILNAEYRNYHRFYHFAGTIDLHCMIYKWEWVIDFKTIGKGYHAPKAAKFQTGAYAMLLQKPYENYKRGCLELYEDGSMANLVPHDDFDDGQHFLCFLDTYNQRRIHGVHND